MKAHITPSHECAPYCPLARSVALQASGAGDNTVRFWDINTETPRHECRAHRQYVLALAWGPDGRRLASGDKVGSLVRGDGGCCNQ